MLVLKWEKIHADSWVAQIAGSGINLIARKYKETWRWGIEKGVDLFTSKTPYTTPYSARRGCERFLARIADAWEDAHFIAQYGMTRMEYQKKWEAANRK